MPTIKGLSRDSNNSKKSYLIDESRIAYGGYSLGGLAAVYSLYSSHLSATCIFSICGSFWYPEFIDFAGTYFDAEPKPYLSAKWSDRRFQSFQSSV